jgi:hypothetical protein
MTDNEGERACQGSSQIDTNTKSIPPPHRFFKAAMIGDDSMLVTPPDGMS